MTRRGSWIRIILGQFCCKCIIIDNLIHFLVKEMAYMNNLVHNQRLSNIELLRILAMLMIMLIHLCCAIGSPNKNDFINHPYFSITRTSIEYISIVGVNVFVLISGWFGITFKWKRLFELYFQIFFFGLLMLIWGLIVNKSSFSLGGLIGMLTMGNNDYWFLKVYVMLYIISPVLNAYIENVSQKSFKTILIAMGVFLFYYGWITPDSTKWLVKGYCLVWFCFLYLLSRYIRLYKTRLSQFSAKTDLIIYLVFTAILIVFGILESYYQIDLKGRWNYYLNPFVLCPAIYLLLFFSKIRFSSKIINTIAISSVAAFLLHANQNFYAGNYLKTIQDWFVSESPVFFLLISIAFIVLLYLIAVIIDKIRLYLWNNLMNVFEKKRLISKE